MRNIATKRIARNMPAKATTARCFFIGTFYPLRFPRFCRLRSFSVRVRLRFMVLASGFIPGQALADDMRCGQLEAVKIR